jgi:hypothetical protein
MMRYSVRALTVFIAATAGVNWWMWGTGNFFPNLVPHAIEGVLVALLLSAIAELLWYERGQRNLWLEFLLVSASLAAGAALLYAPMAPFRS